VLEDGVSRPLSSNGRQQVGQMMNKKGRQSVYSFILPPPPITFIPAQSAAQISPIFPNFIIIVIKFYSHSIYSFQILNLI
jgi:hypothetical protein